MFNKIIALFILLVSLTFANYYGAPSITQTQEFQWLKNKVKESLIQKAEEMKEDASLTKRQVCNSDPTSKACEYYTDEEKNAEKKVETVKKIFDVVDKVEEGLNNISPTTIILRALNGLQGEQPKVQNF
jgi:hypothetical protein